MNKLVLALISAASISINVWAEPAQVPHTFTPNTPAKASEVNANFNALTQALGKIKQFSLYQNDQKIGSSYLLNIIALNTGYLVVPGKEKQSNNVYLAAALGNTIYYTSNNCTGNGYIHGKNLDRLDLLGSEKGIVAPISNQIYSVDLSQTSVSNLYINSFRKGSDGQCTDISAYKVAEQGKCIQEIANNELPPSTRVIERSYTPPPTPSCAYVPPQGCVINPPAQLCQPVYTCNYIAQSPTYSCQILGQDAYHPIFIPGTTQPNPYNQYQYASYSAVKLSKALKNSGILDSAFIVTPNNPQITGITTAFCTDTKGKSLGCATNATLKRE